MMNAETIYKIWALVRALAEDNSTVPDAVKDAARDLEKDLWAAFMDARP